jgi:hypothetical protein
MFETFAVLSTLSVMAIFGVLFYMNSQHKEEEKDQQK